MTEKIDRILRAFEKQGRYYAGELLLTPQDAVSLIHELETANVVVTGVNLWYLIDGRPVESTLYLVLPEDNYGADNAARAREFILSEVPGKLQRGEVPEIPSADLYSVDFPNSLSIVEGLNL